MGQLRRKGRGRNWVYFYRNGRGWYANDGKRTVPRSRGAPVTAAKLSYRDRNGVLVLRRRDMLLSPGLFDTRSLGLCAT
jgi:hypothetical protein